MIIFTDRAGLSRVSAAGGAAFPVTTLDTSREETGHSYPFFLPDGRHFVYLRISSRPENTGIYVGSLDAKPEQQDLRRLMAAESQSYGRSRSPGLFRFQINSGKIRS